MPIEPEIVSNLPRKQTYEERISLLNQQRMIANNVNDLWKSRAKFMLATIGLIILAALTIKIVIILFLGNVSALFTG